MRCALSIVSHCASFPSVKIKIRIRSGNFRADPEENRSIRQKSRNDNSMCSRYFCMLCLFCCHFIRIFFFILILIFVFCEHLFLFAAIFIFYNTIPTLSQQRHPNRRGIWNSKSLHPFAALNSKSSFCWGFFAWIIFEIVNA